MAGAGLNEFAHSIDSVVRGYHVYKDVWQPRLDEILTTRQELGNPEDQHAVVVIKPLDGNEELIYSWACSKRNL